LTNRLSVLNLHYGISCHCCSFPALGQHWHLRPKHVCWSIMPALSQKSWHVVGSNDGQVSIGHSFLFTWMFYRYIIPKCFLFWFFNLSWPTKDCQPQVKTFGLCLWHFLEIWTKPGFCSLFHVLLLAGCWHGRMDIMIFKRQGQWKWSPLHQQWEQKMESLLASFGLSHCQNVVLCLLTWGRVWIAFTSVHWIWQHSFIVSGLEFQHSLVWAMPHLAMYVDKCIHVQLWWDK
jgi:hypothetical protein